MGIAFSLWYILILNKLQPYQWWLDSCFSFSLRLLKHHGGRGGGEPLSGIYSQLRVHLTHTSKNSNPPWSFSSDSVHLPAAAGLSCCFSILRTGKENLPCSAETGGVAVGLFIGGVNGKRQIGIWPRPPPNLLGIIKSFFFCCYLLFHLCLAFKEDWVRFSLLRR